MTTRARIDKAGGRYRATLEIETPSSRGERVLEADTCEALASSARVVIAMAVASESARDEAPAAAPAPLPKRDDMPIDRGAVTRARAPTHVTVRAEAVANAVLMPAVAGGAGLAIGLDALERLHVEIHGAVFAGQTAHLDADRGAHLALASGGARGCWAITRGVEIAPCVGASIARLAATGFGADDVMEGAAVVLSPEALLAARMPLTRDIGLRAGLGALAPLSRQSFVIMGRGTVHEVPAIAVLAFVGPEVRF